ncbi:hypothetical protein HB364_29250 [Pseudoflavitalea sp. X16]|uniref:hypothetical protein n=1 Tax=Paraflavitalea devenefica TaxID=2716334 RepID=UPI0014214CE1|nr:hypothetical protein [Paraflavitalea devenefica]NII29202.1 hypothetical protein [Paraflavitalea devenefica]
MRPLLKTVPQALFATRPVHLLLMETTGEYCHLCESRLPDQARALNKRTGTDLEGIIAPEVWPQVLLTCEVCFKAQQLAALLQSPPASLLYPDEQLTFSVNKETSPFVYEKKPVTRYLLDEDNNAIGSPETVELVIVRGTTESARATINHFDLNSAWYAEADNTLRIPLQEHLSAADLRVHQRTEIWGLVDDYVKRYRQLLELNRDMAGIMLEHGRLLAAASGFWSVWATLLWEGTNDRAALSAVLLPRQANLAAAARAEGQATPHDVFPGTHPDVFR